MIEHLIKLLASPATEPRIGWMEMVDRVRDDMELLMKDSPSPQRFVAEMVEDGTRRSSRRVSRSLERFAEQPRVDIQSLTFMEAQVLEDCFPDENSASDLANG